MRNISFAEAEVLVQEYPYPPSSCYPSRVVPAGEIIDVSPGYPVTMRLRCRDVLFISKEHERAARDFAERNGIPIIHRYDPWDLVLTPFLDTRYTREIHRRTMKLLDRNGISKAQCNQWRRRFKRAMRSYNFDSMLWEWAGLGATDLLDAHLGKLAHPKYKLNAGEFAELYELVISVLFGAAEIPKEELDNREPRPLTPDP